MVNVKLISSLLLMALVIVMFFANRSQSERIGVLESQLEYAGSVSCESVFIEFMADTNLSITDGNYIDSWVDANRIFMPFGYGLILPSPANMTFRRVPVGWEYG